jgi:hypothetical protein
MSTQGAMGPEAAPGTRTGLFALVAIASALAALAIAGPAFASQPIGSFEVSTSTTQAGGHPDLETRLTLQNPGQPEAAENVIVNLPVGLFGNPHAITTCKSADFALAACPISSQAGTITVRANYSSDPNYLLGVAPVYDMEPRSDEETARFAFIVPVLNVPISIPVAVRTGGDYGLRMTVSGITQTMPLASADITIWGFPAASENDNSRFPKGTVGTPAGCPQQASPECASNSGASPHSAGIAVEPLTDNPSTCTQQPLTVTLDVQTYQDPENLSHAEAEYPPTTGCEKQNFNPVFNAVLTTGEADAPSGLDMELKAPLFESKAASPSNIRSATLTLPEGLSINPDAADGQSACTDAEANFHSEAPANCPDNSKIGNFEIGTPALTGPLTGSLYFGEPKPGDQYRVFMIADGFGIHAKLLASVHPTADTGQLVITVNDLPQVPFDQFDLHLFSSQRGLVATPIHCSFYGADSVFVPWNSALAAQTSRPNLSVDRGPNGQPCPASIRPFSPRLVAGTLTPIAGAFSDFSLQLDRDDGDQFLGDLNFKMPLGFTGSLRGISYCPESALAHAAASPGRAEQAQPSCPGSSQIGTSNVAAGPGTHPFHVEGRIYMAGPLKGAPLSLAVITPALAGPYDYGTQVVRVALHIDPITAQVKAVSDTVPQIIGGVPLRLRSIRVSIDRPNFAINPTNCAPLSVDSQGIGDQGTVTDFSSYFHVVNCQSLPFKPKMTFRVLGGNKKTHRSANPPLQIDLWTQPGNANIKSLSVTLPKAFAVDQRHLGNLCSKAQLESESCAGRQVIGNVMTKTPLLDAPLQGAAYAVSGFGKLPRLAFILDGQVRLVPQAESKSVGGRLQTTVPTVPDAPIGHFRLDLLGGKKGYLVNTRSLCKGDSTISVNFAGQNGKARSENVKAKASCGKKSKRTKRHRWN